MLNRDKIKSRQGRVKSSEAQMNTRPTRRLFQLYWMKIFIFVVFIFITTHGTGVQVILLKFRNVLSFGFTKVM